MEAKNNQTATQTETRIERKRRAKKQAILERALVILNEQGLNNISLNQLAKSLDYVPAAIYRYFPSWQDLLFHLQVLVLERARLNLQDSVDFSFAQEQTPVEEALIRHLFDLSEWCCAFSQQSPNEFGLLSQMIADPKQLLDEDYLPYSSEEALLFLQYFHKAFELAKQSKAMDYTESSEAITFSFIISTLGLLQGGKLTRFLDGMPDAVELTRNHTAIFLKGVGAQPVLVNKVVASLNTKQGGHA